MGFLPLEIPVLVVIIYLLTWDLLSKHFMGTSVLWISQSSGCGVVKATSQDHRQHTEKWTEAQLFKTECKPVWAPARVVEGKPLMPVLWMFFISFFPSGWICWFWPALVSPALTWSFQPLPVPCRASLSKLLSHRSKEELVTDAREGTPLTKDPDARR